MSILIQEGTVSDIFIGSKNGVLNAAKLYIGDKNGVPQLVWSKIAAEQVVLYTLTDESGTFIIPANSFKIQVFLVGGGGAGNVGFRTYYMNQSGGWEYTSYYGGGGGGGYTYTSEVFSVVPGQAFNYEVGRGGNKIEYYGYGKAGGTTRFGEFSALGGNTIIDTSNWYAESSNPQSSGEPDYNFRLGMPGGSRGGNGCGYKGYTDGNPTTGYNRGQGFTTRAFGEVDGTLYSSGGKGGGSNVPLDGVNYGDGGDGGNIDSGSGSGANGIILVRCFVQS